MPSIVGIGILEHLIYGAVLGAVTTLLMVKVGMKWQSSNIRSNKELR
jgi:hypothetical protein